METNRPAQRGAQRRSSSIARRLVGAPDMNFAGMGTDGTFSILSGDVPSIPVFLVFSERQQERHQILLFLGGQLGAQDQIEKLD